MNNRHDLPTRIRDEYYSLLHRAERFSACVEEQLKSIVVAEDVTLGVPMELRVKTLSSVVEKVAERGKAATVSQVDDLVGARCILLFRPDVVKLDAAIKRTFEVQEYEDVSSRLRVDEFGYQSSHYIVSIPTSWSEVPSYTDLIGLKAEIQVRTLAQHIWAAGSHKLQYKREASVPAPLRRSISRVSALLETIDLEFERFLEDREKYRSESTSREDAKLNVELVADILRDIWPPENIDNQEEYSSLLEDLIEEGIETEAELRSFLAEWREAGLSAEREVVAKHDLSDYDNDDFDRFEQGVFYTHCGLTRMALRERDRDCED